jgi:hypothetical protein
MALTAAERQKRYRESKKLADNGYRQVNLWISTEAYLALRRMARRDGVTQRETLERLLVRAQDELVSRMSDGEFADYLLLGNE